MKQLEKCSGRGCESPQVHQKYITLPKGWLTVVGRISSFSLYASNILLMGLHSFDRANSTEVDNSSEKMLKLKQRKRKRRNVRISSLNTA